MQRHFRANFEERGDLQVIRLDGVIRYGAAFLEAVYGDLNKETGMNYGEFKSRVEIVTNMTIAWVG